MKTPHAILIGLSLIAAVIFFNDTAVKPAYAYGNPATKSDVKSAIRDCLNYTAIHRIDSNSRSLTTKC